jgi:hypothetical protein
MTVFDKIYGQQSFIVASKLIAVGNKIAPYLQCLSEFRMSYVQEKLNEVFKSDQILLSYLGLKHQGKTKQIPKNLTSDV